MNPLVAYGLVQLVSQIFEVLSRSSSNRFVAAREINALGVPPRETDLIMRLAAPRYSEHESAAMANLLQLTSKLLLRDSRVLADDYLVSVKSALTNGFLTLIPSIVVALPASLSGQYYSKNTTEKVALASDVATAFTGRWNTFSQGGKTKLLTLLGQPASLATKPVTTAGSTPPPSSSGTGSPGSGSTGSSTGAGSSGGGSTGGATAAPGAARPANPSINANQGSRNSETPPRTGDVWDPEAGSWMSAAEYQSWKQAGWFLDDNGDWQQAVAGSIYDPAIDGYWSPEQMSNFQENGWSMSADGLWTYSEETGVGVIDPETGDYMSRQEYADWKELGWSIITDPVDGSQSWYFEEPLDSTSVYDPETGGVMSREEYEEWQSAGWSISEDGSHWEFDAGSASSIVDPDTGLSMSADEYESWNEQGWFIDPQGSWIEVPIDDGPQQEIYPDDPWGWDYFEGEPDQYYPFNEGEPTAAKQTFGGAQLPIDLATIGWSHAPRGRSFESDLPDSPPPFDDLPVVDVPASFEIDEIEVPVREQAHDLPTVERAQLALIAQQVGALPLDQLNNALAFVAPGSAPASTSREAVERIRLSFGRDELSFASMLQSLIDAPKTDWAAIEAANELARQAAREKEQYEKEMAEIGWNIDDEGAWTWDQSVEDARIAAIYESVGLVQNADGTWGFADSQQRVHDRGAKSRVARRVARHDSRCLCDSCVGRVGDGQFDVPSNLPLGQFHSSSWLNCSLADWAPGEYGEVIIDFEKTPFEVTLNRNVAPARREASLIHEALHVADEWFKTNMSHDNLHAVSTFISKEILPAVEALRTLEAQN